jgi:hypothetical protein
MQGAHQLTRTHARKWHDAGPVGCHGGINHYGGTTAADAVGGLASARQQPALDGSHVHVALLDDIGELGLVGDLPMLVLCGLVGSVCVEPLLGGGGLLELVAVDTASGEFDARALFGGTGFGRVCVPEGTGLVGLLEFGSAPVEQVGKRVSVDGITFQPRAPLGVGTPFTAPP